MKQMQQSKAELEYNTKKKHTPKRFDSKLSNFQLENQLKIKNIDEATSDPGVSG